MKKPPLEPSKVPLQRKTELKRTPMKASPAPLKRSPWPSAAIPTQRAHLRANAAPSRGKTKAVRQQRRHDTGPTPKTVELVWQRDEGRCFRCGSPLDFAARGVGWSVQHRRARGMGGTRRPDTNQPQALILLCGSATTLCHGDVESNRTDALSNGWAVKSNSVPEAAPVLHWRHGLVLLTADGRVVPVGPKEEAA